MKPIYLCGFMGCGKSYTGRKSARETGIRHIDLDDFLVGREKMEISEIFKKYGEKHFRNLEFEALCEISSEVSEFHPAIISLGGGALTNPETAAFAKKNAVVIFIDTPFDTCYERVKNDVSRPNAAGKSKEELFALYKSREEHYKKAADYIKTGGDKEIVSLIKQLSGGE
ncbi:MAG: shikimate kinase [Oscillospiraceae bacterium]|nr:shikimate kinase [Oscillospiraceae bacterium]